MIETLYRVTCAGCSATATGTESELVDAGWRAVTPTAGRFGTVFDYPSGGLDAVCKDCVASVQDKIDAASAAQQALVDAVGKFDGTSGKGTEANPLEFQPGVLCVLNAYYVHDGKLYVYMPADAEAKSYGSWEDAEADFAEWASE